MRCNNDSETTTTDRLGIIMLAVGPSRWSTWSSQSQLRASPSNTPNFFKAESSGFRLMVQENKRVLGVSSPTCE